MYLHPMCIAYLLFASPFDFTYRASLFAIWVVREPQKIGCFPYRSTRLYSGRYRIGTRVLPEYSRRYRVGTRVLQGNTRVGTRLHRHP